jgi:ABC-type branched-subunit amino acid transport system ATPase component
MNVGRKIAEGPPAGVLADKEVVQAYLGGGDA